MEYTVEHETVYEYPRSVTESYTVVHLQPRTNLRQYCTGYRLDVTPSSRVFSYVDRFGNDVQHFAIVPEHTELRIVARSHVVTLPANGNGPTRGVRAEDLDADPRMPELAEFRGTTPYVCVDDTVAELARDIARAGRRPRRVLPRGGLVPAPQLQLPARRHRRAHDRRRRDRGARRRLPGLRARADRARAQPRHPRALCERLHLPRRRGRAGRRRVARVGRSVPAAVRLGRLRPDQRPARRRRVRARRARPRLRRRQPDARPVPRRRSGDALGRGRRRRRARATASDEQSSSSSSSRRAARASV